MEAIRQSYCAALPEKLARIEHLWQSLQRNTGDNTSYEEFYRLLHSMAGSAETFGLPDLTKAARRIVQQLKQTQQTNTLADVSDSLLEISKIILTVTQK